VVNEMSGVGRLAGPGSALMLLLVAAIFQAASPHLYITGYDRGAELSALLLVGLLQVAHSLLLSYLFIN
jgi:hypothetical protein